MKKILAALLLSLATATSYGAFSTVLDAGQLKLDASTAMASGANGAVLVFITAGANGVFDTPNNLSAGNYVAGDDVLLSVFTDPSSGQPFNTAGGTNETNSVFAISSVVAPTNQLLGLMWFPGITYSQWQVGAVPANGQKFGFYNPLFYGNATNNPDGGDVWAVPASGLVNLNMFTTDSSGGGTQAPSEGLANFTVTTTAVPEPSAVAQLLTGAVIGAGMLLRRSKR
jgi:hypothetical protein